MPYNETTHVDPKIMPYDTGRSDNWHRHICDSCGVEWAHDGKQRRSFEEYQHAHRCPKCKEEQVWCALPGEK